MRACFPSWFSLSYLFISHLPPVDCLSWLVQPTASRYISFRMLVGYSDFAVSPFSISILKLKSIIMSTHVCSRNCWLYLCKIWLIHILLICWYVALATMFVTDSTLLIVFILCKLSKLVYPSHLIFSPSPGFHHRGIEESIHTIPAYPFTLP